MLQSFVWLLLTAGCAPIDADGDGFVAGLDCDDADIHVSPTAVESCNGKDDDCDGSVDEGLTETWYADADHDGNGDPDVSTDSCDRPDATVANADDCDDADPEVRPNAPERCNGEDDDCDGAVDEDLEASYFEDNDEDGIGGAEVQGCAPDGVPTASIGGDCDDADPTVNPRAQEVCDGVDQDCDQLVDEGVGVPFYPDADGDGYGDEAAPSVNSCDGSQPPGTVSDHTDCDDARADVFQGAPEVCDGVDDNCNGKVDEVGSIQYWVDADGDGWGDPASWAWLCGPTAGYANNDYDCDDAEPLAHTGAGEVCDGVDNDCDGSVDEGVALTWYPDADGDGWGDELLPTSGCSAPSSGVVFVGRDCDDARDDVNPEGEEVCDFVDQDCDGLVDEGSSNTWWTDADGDGYGDPAGMVVGCVIPPDASLDPTDCDDGDPSAHPGGVEVCDGVDQNCDGVADEGLASLFFADGDGDGVGSLDAPFQRACTAPVGMVDVAGDCDDGDPLISGCAATLTTEWTTFGADAGRTGYVPGYVAGGALAAGWSYTDVGRTVLPPVIAGGDLVLTGNGSTDAVTALDRVTGAQDWQYTLVSGTYPTGPSVGDGVVVVQRMDSSNSYLVGLDQAAGTQLWRTPVNNALDPYAAPLIFDGRAYAGAGVGLLYAIDDAVGTLTWTASLPYVDTWTPVGFGGQVYAQVADRLRSFDRATGAAKLDVALPAGPLVPGTMGGVPAIADGVALLVAGDDLVAVDVPAGTIRWTVADGFSGSPTVAHGLGYAIRDGDVTQVDLADGYVFRDFVGDGALVGKPVLTDDVVIASSATNTFVWTLWDGVVVDSIASGGSLVVGDGTLALTSGSTVQTYTW